MLNKPKSSIAAGTVLSFQQCLDQSNGNLVRKYSNQRQYFHIELVDNILDISKDDSICAYKISSNQRVKTIDLKFDDSYEYMSKFYGNCDTIIEMAELCEYYRYYLEMPMIVQATHFKILFAYSERKKQVVYRRLKKVLDLGEKNSNSLIESSQLKNSLNGNVNTNNYLENILKGVSIYSTISQEKDESQCFNILKQKLVKKFGYSKIRDMQDVDQIYNFKNLRHEKDPILMFRRSITSKNAKGSVKIANKKQLMKKMVLQSTNNSSLQLPYSIYSSSKNVSGQQNQPKSVHAHFRQKKESSPYRPTLEITKKGVVCTYKKQQPQNKKKLRKRSCENIGMKKFKTLDDENLAYPTFEQIAHQLRPNGKNRKFQRSQVKSCQSKFDIKNWDNGFRQKSKAFVKMKKEISPHSKKGVKDIKETIDILKSKIRKQKKQVQKPGYNQNQVDNMRFHTTQTVLCGKITQKQAAVKRKMVLNSENRKNTREYKISHP